MSNATNKFYRPERQAKVKSSPVQMQTPFPPTAKHAIAARIRELRENWEAVSEHEGYGITEMYARFALVLADMVDAIGLTGADRTEALGQEIARYTEAEQ